MESGYLLINILEFTLVFFTLLFPFIIIFKNLFINPGVDGLTFHRIHFKTMFTKYDWENGFMFWKKSVGFFTYTDA